MGPITSFYPAVREIPLGGRTVRASELRLADLVDLQAYLDAAAPDPLAASHGELAGLSGPARMECLKKIRDVAAAGAPVYGEASGAAVFSTLAGSAFFVWVALRRHNPEVNGDTAAKLMLDATPAEFGLLHRIAHGVTALKAVERMMFVDAPGGSDGGTVTWARAIDELSRERGWTYAQIADLTITQWIAARTHADPAATSPSGRPLAPHERGETLAESMKRQRINYWGYDPHEKGGG